MDIEKIGKFIKELRNEKNISQNELSEEIHVTRQAISNWENGKAIPDSDILLTLSSLFGVSINEILSGERNTSESNLRDITLQLIDENNSKKRKIKIILFTSVLLITSLVVFFLGYYFINNYNSIKVYGVNGKSDNFKSYNGIFISTKNKLYIRLGKINRRGKKKIDKINGIQLFYLNDKKEKVSIIEDNNTDILIDEDFGYKEYFYNTNLSNVLNSMYIEISYNEKEKEIIKLKFDEKFKNNYLFKTIEKQKVLKDEIKPETILKKDRQIEEILSKEKTKVDELMEKRKTLDIKKNDNTIYRETPSEKIVYINNNENEPQQEEMIEQIEEDNISQEIKMTEEKETPISNDEKENEKSYVDTKVSIKEIIKIVKEKGEYLYGNYIYEFSKDKEMFSVFYDEYVLSIEIINNNTIENYQIYMDTRDYSYQKFENGNEVEMKYGLISEDEIIDRLILEIYNQ